MSVTTLPDGPDLDLASVTTESQTIEPSLTYRIRYDTDGQIRGYCDELEAMKQAIYKIINTERYQYIIYSWNYGIELRDLFGHPIPFVYAEVQRRIKEALLQDDRITAVTDFEFSNNDGDVAVHFNVSTIYGDVTDVKKVVYGVV